MWWSDKVPLPSSALRLLRNVTLRLRRSDMAPAPVMQLHVAKTAGTSLCHWANRSGFSSLLPVGLMNRCQLLGDGPFWFGERASPASCPQRLVELAEKNLTWSSLERWLDLPLCHRLRYVTLLRWPVARTVHHFMHIISFFNLGRYDLQEVFNVSTLLGGGFFTRLLRLDGPQFLEQGHQGGGASWSWPLKTWTLPWLQLWRGFASNYQVRCLAGAAFGWAFLEKEVDHRLEAAKQVLEQFDAVLVVGHGPVASWQTELLSELLPTALRRPAEMPQVTHMRDLPGESPTKSFAFFDYPWLPGELEALQWANRADALLVEHASHLQRLDWEMLLKGCRAY